MTAQDKVSRYVRDLRQSSRLGAQVVHVQDLPGQKASFQGLDQPWPKPIQDLLQGMGIENLYSHQAQALNKIRAGKHTVISTPTASGKSLIYNLPVWESILQDPGSRSLYLFPLKALAQDQLRVMQEDLDNWEHSFRPEIAVYDGDTPRQDRVRIKTNPPHILLSNPEMLHLGILPYHQGWREFLSRLKFVVVDEVHTYRGIMGSNMAWVFRRLLRICRFYGAQPTFIFCSATVGNPQELAAELSGLQVCGISQNGAPRGPRQMVFYNPLEGAARGALDLLRPALERGLRSIVYTQSRKMTELIAMWSKQRCSQYSSRISAYRSGFLPSERRSIEAALSQGDLLAVISTSALELGIDIGELDLCLLVGYPGSVMATWQRAGRVGRQLQSSAVVLIGHENSLDQYFMAHPKDFFSLAPEKAVINPLNPVLLQRHLQCAASDLALEGGDPLLQQREVQDQARQMLEQGLLLQSGCGNYFYSSKKSPQQEVSLRGAGHTLQIRDASTDKDIGSIDYYRAFHETHPGAVYLHWGRTYVIQELEPEQGLVWARPKKVDYFTRVRTSKQTEILEVFQSRDLGGASIYWGRLRVQEEITGYEQRRVKGQILMRVVPLDLGPLIFETQGVWLELPAGSKQECDRGQLHFMGGLHALEHGFIGCLPLIILTDRNDLGGIAQPERATGTVFIFDGHPGGVGLAKQIYASFQDLVQRTSQVLGSCGCEMGCPACVHSPKCGSGNRPLDKNAALFLLQSMASAKVVQNRDRATNNPAGAKQGQKSSQSVSRSGATTSKQSKEAKPRRDLPQDYGVLDLETQRSAQEVGGWKQAHRMGVSCAVLWDSRQGKCFSYLDAQVPELLEHLQDLPLVVGFNLLRFDYQVLRGYKKMDFNQLPTLDILQEVYTRLGFRLSLDHLARATLGIEKSANGLQALTWWQQGELEKIMEYCREDVLITQGIFEYGRSQGYLLYQNKAKDLVRVPVQW
ncbi:MAG: DEAD/DEAH box helicase [Desulfohalobiaceae bacterium]